MLFVALRSHIDAIHNPSVATHNTSVHHRDQDKFFSMSRGGGGVGGVAQLRDDLGDDWKDHGL